MVVRDTAYKDLGTRTRSRKHKWRELFLSARDFQRACIEAHKVVSNEMPRLTESNRCAERPGQITTTNMYQMQHVRVHVHNAVNATVDDVGMLVVIALFVQCVVQC